MSVKVLILFAIFCVSQNGVPAASLNGLEKLELMERNSYAAAQPMGLFQCIPHLLNVWRVSWDVFGVISQFNRLRSELTNAIEKCKKLNSDEQEKCRQKAEREAEEKSKNLYSEIQKVIPRVLDLLNKFRTCLFS